MMALTLTTLPVADVGKHLAVYIPAAVPRCCAHHAIATVRHTGTLYGAVLQAHGGRLPVADYLRLKADVSARIRAELLHAGRLPRRERCVNKPVTQSHVEKRHAHPLISPNYSQTTV